MVYTYFWDMHSGGNAKLANDIVFIEAPRAEAEAIFLDRFGRDPNYVTCDCCGPDYSVDETDSPDYADEYTTNPLVITRADIAGTPPDYDDDAALDYP